MFLRILLSILVSGLIGMLCSNMAQKKGKNSMLWFQIGFCFGIFGIALFFFTLLKDKISSKSKPAQQEFALNAQAASSVEETPKPIISHSTQTSLEDREWFYLDQNNKVNGGISFKVLKELIQKKAIHDTTLIWSEGMDSWKKLVDLSYLKLVLNLD